jgi:cation diffusion facilitator CzcD-associated flavoprotein CzcO
MQGEIPYLAFLERKSYPTIWLSCRRLLTKPQRRIFDRGYLSTLHEPNMRLTSTPITSITSNSVITSSGEEIPVDAILLANGFALTHYDVELRGRYGKTREQHWKEYGHKATYKSIAMHGFPNFFYVLGPNSGRLYTSTIQIIER